MNQLKTGGGKPEHIPPDDALDRVASILGVTCEGFPVLLGGDAEPMSHILQDSDAEDLPDNMIVLPGDIPTLSMGKREVVTASDEGASGSEVLVKAPRPKIFFGTPKGNSLARKRKLLEEDYMKSKVARNLAMAKTKEFEVQLETKELLKKIYIRSGKSGVDK